MMTDVFLERRWPEPLTDASRLAIFTAAAGCLDIHRIDWQESLLSADGRDMFCHFRSPDAESVRIAMRQWNMPAGVVWNCRVHDAPELQEEDLNGGNLVIGQRFESPASFDARPRFDQGAIGNGPSPSARFLRSYLSCDGLRMVSLYHAPDPDLFLLKPKAESPPNQVWTVRRYAP